MTTHDAVFTDVEIQYLKSQFLGRFATVDAQGRPHVMPVGVFVDLEEQAIVVAGHTGTNMAASKKFTDARLRPDVAFVVDDLASTDPWTPRGVEIRGRAETFTEGGEQLGRRLDAMMPFDPAWIRIRPRRILAWGLDAEVFELNARDVAGTS
ncbi:pyridoxamine 5'-phosphate oxidase family protein [Haloactinopolyspora alba]|uniref:Pyridoxamine 5'-phosphate oxidase family protein n=1 Tax=Haloactinopolyspora alba TaxID=648780 RepID=A0A2P8DKX8_9ACTN|nr:PPOX class F420-dependent oxidoreductase [Haloactinopolyspora alba]PSK97859.1 pyridoxamine 5'-phosphate oxidase family protein [Haloactinopolyspora alba]